MKTIKNDTRYIIKRIIIGVGIALILAFINNNKVFADEINNKYYCFHSNNTSVNTTCSLSNTNSYSLNLYSSNSENVYWVYPADISNIVSITLSLKNKINNDYLLFEIPSSTRFGQIDSLGLWDFDNVGLYSFTEYNSPFTLQKWNNGEISLQNGTSPIFITTDYNRALQYKQSSVFNTSYTPKIQQIDNYYFVYRQNSGYQSNILQYFDSDDWYYNNYSYSSFYNNINLNEIEVISSNGNVSSSIEYNPIPPGYSKIDLTGNEAVYFVPKNYNQVNIEHIDDVDYYDFNYYYTGSIKEGWFPLNNLNDLFLDDYMSNNTSIDEVSYRDSFFPMYEDSNDTALGYNYYAYIIFNNNQENSSIWYYSSQFDAYKITNMEEYNQNICFEDRTNEEFCIDINFSSLISNYWIQGFNDDNSSFSGEQESSTNKLSNLFNFLKMPFTFLNSLKTYTCSSINIPIPFVNGNMQINCLSSKFRSVLGQNFYNIIVYIITGFYAYRITIMNIDTLTDILNPNDDKLEVVDL